MNKQILLVLRFLLSYVLKIPGLTSYKFSTPFVSEPFYLLAFDKTEIYLHKKWNSNSSQNTFTSNTRNAIGNSDNKEVFNSSKKVISKTIENIKYLNEQFLKI